MWNGTYYQPWTPTICRKLLLFFFGSRFSSWVALGLEIEIIRQNNPSPNYHRGVELILGNLNFFRKSQISNARNHPSLVPAVLLNQRSPSVWLQQPTHPWRQLENAAARLNFALESMLAAWHGKILSSLICPTLSGWCYSVWSRDSRCP